MTGWNKFVHDFQGKKILIMGLGLQGGGVEVAKVFAHIGCKVTVTDLRHQTILKSSLQKLSGLPIRFVLGKHRRADFINHDVIIRSPAVPKDSSFLKLAQAAHVSIKMETSLFVKYTPATIVGITGTRGKTTTAHLIYEILKQAGKKVLLAGNIPGLASLPLLKITTSNHIVVLELSSWQLQGFRTEKVSPHIAVVTNIYPDHLDRYSSMDKYVADKAAISSHQISHDYLVLSRSNPYASVFTSTQAKVIWFEAGDVPKDIPLKLPGQHNRDNTAAALKTVEILHINRASAISTATSFSGLPFRLELVARIKGINIINDTTSTTPIATIKALETVTPPIILILGGETKRLPVKELAQTVNQKAHQVILLSGSGTQEIKPLINRELVAGEFVKLKDAVKTAFKLAPPSGTIVFSPGFTSFGMFNNEFDRGRAFNLEIKRLII